jgi:tetratricopeptide (TPR) repeat protein
LLLAGIARADHRDVAREAFREGSLQYDLGDYQAALAAFKRAYLAFEDPVFLFNIGQCQRHLGQKADALHSFKVFLAKLPNNRSRGQVEKLIQELQAALDQDAVAATHPPTETMPPAPAETAPPAPTVVTGRPAAAVVAAPAPSPKKKIKPWVWGVVVGGVVVAAGAITLGVLLGTRHSNNYVELTY